MSLLIPLFLVKVMATNEMQVVDDCSVVIAGGSVAAFAAALASASENVTTCLLEPTDWVGGQMTANGVPALDFAPEGYPTQVRKTPHPPPPPPRTHTRLAARVPDLHPTKVTFLCRSLGTPPIPRRSTLAPASKRC